MAFLPLCLGAILLLHPTCDKHNSSLQQLVLPAESSAAYGSAEVHMWGFSSARLSVSAIILLATSMWPIFFFSR